MKVVITRPLEEGKRFASLLKEAGSFEPVLLPTLEIVYRDVDIDLGRYKWIVFTSPRGVRGLFKNLDEERLREIRDKKIGAIGRETAGEFKRLFNRDVDILPDRYTAEDLLEALKGAVGDEKLLIPTTPATRDVLSRHLKGDVVYVYNSKEPEDLKYRIKELKDMLVEEEDKAVFTFTSGLTVKNFFKNLDEEFLELLKDHYIVSIGPITNKVLESYGFKGYIPKEYTVKGMIQVIKSLR
ncbi:MAG TPA: uroporphyrinogen-III synthase [Methanococcaceae archaeon]|uniref:Uroporphyrinogen-III synthase n=1 Tax=Methanothermococcus okinawensis TaxID=155863 RepID=A0A832ZI40_9EURY|nr:uroporphyrinogen-III synthase [Methanococcaceae archaeon]HIP90932.1 uroporphyrinogen-III synthase [Methanothermococcus okinawensis]